MLLVGTGHCLVWSGSSFRIGFYSAPRLPDPGWYVPVSEVEARSAAARPAARSRGRADRRGEARSDGCRACQGPERADLARDLQAWPLTSRAARRREEVARPGYLEGASRRRRLRQRLIRVSSRRALAPSGLDRTERRRSRTYSAAGYATSPVLKTGRICPEEYRCVRGVRPVRARLPQEYASVRLVRVCSACPGRRLVDGGWRRRNRTRAGFQSPVVTSCSGRARSGTTPTRARRRSSEDSPNSACPRRRSPTTPGASPHGRTTTSPVRPPSSPSFTPGRSARRRRPGTHTPSSESRSRPRRPR